MSHGRTHSAKTPSRSLRRRLFGVLLVLLATAAHAEGDLDTAFGSGGFVSLPGGDGLFNTIPLGALAPLADGGLQLAICDAACDSTTVDTLHVYRLRADGQRDTRFGPAGDGHRLLTECVGEGLRRMALRTTPDQGALVYTGACLIKLTPQGEFDTTYANNGQLPLGSGTNAWLGLDSQGRAVLAATEGNDCRLQRRLVDGRVDDSYGVNGEQRIADCQTNAVAMRPDDSLVLGGNQRLVQVDGDGQIDSRFGQQGRVALAPPPGMQSQRMHAIALAPGGEIAVAGQGVVNSNGNWITLARLRADGTLAAFGHRFYAIQSATTLNAFFDTSMHVIALPGGATVMAFNAFPRQLARRTDFALLRINADGSRDTSLGPDGIRYYDMPDLSATGRMAPYDQLHDVYVADGTFVLFGRTLFEDAKGGQLARPVSLMRLSIERLFTDGFDTAL